MRLAFRIRNANETMRIKPVAWWLCNSKRSSAGEYDKWPSSPSPRKLMRHTRADFAKQKRELNGRSELIGLDFFLEDSRLAAYWPAAVCAVFTIMSFGPRCLFSARFRASSNQFAMNSRRPLCEQLARECGATTTTNNTTHSVGDQCRE